MFFLFLFFFQNTFQSQLCQPSGIYVTLGDYFSYRSEVYYNISFMMNRDCNKKIFVKYYETIEDTVLLQDPTVRHYDIKGKFYKENLDYHRDFYFFEVRELQTLYRFQYQIQDEDENILAGPFEFNFDFDKNELKIITFGDHDFEQGQAVYDSLLKEDYDLLILLGDYSYNIQDNNGQHGDYYIDKWRDLFATKPVIMFTGNHEDIDDFKMFNYRLKNPGTITPDDNNYFHFRIKNTLMFSINFDVYINAKNKEQILENLQKRVDLYKHEKITHKILLTHRPIYGQTQEPEHDKEFELNPLILSEIEEFLIKNKFDFIISAHAHFYQRSKPIQRYEFKGNLRQLVVGTGSSKHIFQTVNLQKLEQMDFTLQQKRGYEVIHLQSKEYRFYFQEVKDQSSIIYDMFQTENYGRAQKDFIYILLFVVVLLIVLLVFKYFQNKDKRQKVAKEVQMSMNSIFSKKDDAINSK